MKKEKFYTDYIKKKTEKTDLSKISKEEWNRVLKQTFVPFEVLKPYLSKIPAVRIFEHIPLTYEEIDYIIEQKGGIDGFLMSEINTLLENQFLSEEQLEKFADNFSTSHWDTLSIYQKLPEPFIEKYSEHFSWENICSHQNLSEDFIRKHLNKITTDIAEYQVLSEKFITEELIPFYKKNYDDFMIKRFFTRLFKNKKITMSENFFIKNREYISFSERFEDLLFKENLSEDEKTEIKKNLEIYAPYIKFEHFNDFFRTFYKISKLNIQIDKEKLKKIIINNLKILEYIPYIYTTEGKNEANRAMQFIFELKDFSVLKKVAETYNNMDLHAKLSFDNFLIKGNKRLLIKILKELSFSELKKQIEEKTKNKNTAQKLFLSEIQDFYQLYSKILNTDIKKLLPKTFINKSKNIEKG